jgi:hypothetical protein
MKWNQQHFQNLLTITIIILIIMTMKKWCDMTATCKGVLASEIISTSPMYQIIELTAVSKSLSDSYVGSVFNRSKWKSELKIKANWPQV